MFTCDVIQRAILNALCRLRDLSDDEFSNRVNGKNVNAMLELHIAMPLWLLKCWQFERLALPILDHGVVGSNPAGGKILPEPKRRFIGQSLSRSPSHRLEMTEMLLKGRKILTHPSINSVLRLLEHGEFWHLFLWGNFSCNISLQQNVITMSQKLPLHDVFVL